MNPIDNLRKRVSNIDQEIVRLIGKRIELIKEIGKKKKKEKMPLRNLEVEKKVIKNATRVARKLCIPDDLIKSIMLQFIAESRIQQERLYYSAFSGAKENILIVGGLGDMGRWFSYFFQNQGHKVTIYDTKGSSKDFLSYRSLRAGFNKASCMLIATPLEIVPGTIGEVTKLNFKGLIFDVASLKGHLKSAIQRAIKRGISITSIHPMFGPNARTLSDKVICICDCGDEKANQKVGSFFKDTPASIVKLSLDEHDRMITYVLGLSHIINIVFTKVLMESGYKYDELRRIASTTFLSQMVTTETVINENPQLYYAIQRLNPFKEDLYKNLNKTVKSITDIVLANHKSKFAEIMKNGKRWIET